MEPGFEDYLEKIKLPSYHSPVLQARLEGALLGYHARLRSVRRRNCMLAAVLVLGFLAWPVSLWAKSYHDEIQRELLLRTFRLMTRLNRATDATGRWILRRGSKYVLLSVDWDTVVLAKAGERRIMTIDTGGVPLDKKVSVIRQVESLRRRGRDRVFLGGRGNGTEKAKVYRYSLPDGRQVWASEGDMNLMDGLNDRKMTAALGLPMRKTGGSYNFPAGNSPSTPQHILR